MLIVNLTNYAASSTSFTLTVTTKQIQKYSLSVNNGANATQISTPQDEGFTLAISLIDPITGGPLTGATVTTNIGGTVYAFVEQNSGNYTLVITAADLGKLGLKGYLLSIQVSKENYTAPVISLSLTVSLPVDPYFGVPYMYWMIIGVAVMSFCGNFRH